MSDNEEIDDIEMLSQANAADGEDDSDSDSSIDEDALLQANDDDGSSDGRDTDEEEEDEDREELLLVSYLQLLKKITEDKNNYDTYVLLIDTAL